MTNTEDKQTEQIFITITPLLSNGYKKEFSIERLILKSEMLSIGKANSGPGLISHLYLPIEDISDYEIIMSKLLIFYNYKLFSF